MRPIHPITSCTYSTMAIKVLYASTNLSARGLTSTNLPARSPTSMDLPARSPTCVIQPIMNLPAHNNYQV